MNNKPKPQWVRLLHEALTTPGSLSDCYSQFHRFSFLNQIEAWSQCVMRGIQPGPIACYKAWQAKGRQVRKGEQAIRLWMPINRTVKETKQEGTREFEVTRWWTEFRYLPRWFVLAQTEGEPLEPEPIPEWDLSRALAELNVSLVPYSEINGNCQGYAFRRSIAVNPLAANPHKTRFHELAHVVLGHTDRDALMVDSRELTRDIAELEAEAVALICAESLGLAGAAESRGYIQHWYSGSEVPSESAKRIFAAADKILKAGEVAKVEQAVQRQVLDLAA
jgi:antirestriction protein ArdC